MKYFALALFGVVLGFIGLQDVFSPPAPMNNEKIDIMVPELIPKREESSGQKVYLKFSKGFTGDNRNFNFKAVFEYNNMTQCEQALSKQKAMPAPSYYVCGANDLCPSIEDAAYECSYSVDEKYKRMLNQQFGGTHFLHIKNTTAAETGVLAFWGMTDDEAKRYCEFLIQQDTPNGLTNQCF